MSAATHIHRQVHVPITLIVWLIAVLAVIIIASAAVTAWKLSSAASGIGIVPTQIRLAPAPMPGPVAELARIVVS